MPESRHGDDDDDGESRSGYHSSSRLARLENRKDWSDWKFKTTAHFQGREILIDAPLPTRGATHRTTAERVQDQAEYDALLAIHAQNLAIAAESAAAGGNFACETIEPVLRPLSRQEPDDEFELRLNEHSEESAAIWTAIVRCAKGEALTIIKGLDSQEQDGRKAFQALENRFGEAGTSSMFLVLKELLSLKQTGSVPKHVVRFEQVRQKVEGLGITMLDEMFTVIFLQSLNKSFATFVTYTLLDSKSTKISCSQIMANAEEHARTRVGGDEANHKNTALAAAEVGKCQWGASCRNWVAGKCNKFHPAPGQDAGKGKGKGKGQRAKTQKQKEWWCLTCNTKNFGFRTHFFNEECNLKKPGGRGQKRKGDWGGKGGSNQENASMADEVARLTKQLKTAQNAVEEAGVDIDIGYTAEERMDTAFDAMSIGHQRMIKFKCDSGASSHFSNFDLPVVNSSDYSSTVDIADGSSIQVTKKAKFEGVTLAGDKLTMDVKQSEDFQSNLFSVKKATECDMRAVFDSKGSYLQHKSTGVKVPLTNTSTGWDVQFQAKGDGVT